MNFKNIIMKGLLIGMMTTSAHTNTNAYTHIHPVSNIPETISINKNVDTVGNHVIEQIHKSLFVLDSNTPKPDLVETRFTLSPDRKTYSFKLKKVKFHDGSPLDFTDVKHSFETLIKTKTASHEKLSGIIGYNELKNGEASHLSGVTGTNDPLDLVIELEAPDPELPFKFCSPMLSIVPSSAPNTVGLGPYKLTSFSKKKLVLNLSNGNGNKQIPSTVEYIRTTKKEAIRMFKEKKVHDLATFPVDESEAKELNSISKKKRILTPRIYFLAINSKAISDQSVREAIFSKIDRQQIIDSCFPGNVLNNNIAPKSFLGHDPKLQLNFSDKKLKLNSLSINVAKGIGREGCVQKLLGEMLDPYCDNLTVSIENTSSKVQDWHNGKLSMLITYYQPFNSLDFFQPFNPSNYFHFANHEDKEIEEIIKKNNSTSIPSENIKFSKQINNRVLKQATFLPLFNPTHYIVYSNRYKDIKKTIPVADLKFNDLILSTQ